MQRGTHYIGRIKRTPDGELLVDTDSLRRPQFAGDDDYDDDLGYEDDDDDLGYEDDDDDLSGDFVDDLDGDFVDDLGGKRRKRRRRRRRAGGRGRGRGRGPAKGKQWAKTVVSGNVVLAAAGSDSIQIRLQHDFKAEDLTFEGSLAASTVNSIQFGDYNVWSSPAGVDVSVFSVTGFMRDLLRGQSIGKGLDITINVTTPGAGTVTATLTGYKPAAQNCP